MPSETQVTAVRMTAAGAIIDSVVARPKTHSWTIPSTWYGESSDRHPGSSSCPALAAANTMTMPKVTYPMIQIENHPKAA